MDNTDALSRSRCREQQFNNSTNGKSCMIYPMVPFAMTLSDS